jgi:hypothetical protein
MADDQTTPSALTDTIGPTSAAVAALTMRDRTTNKLAMLRRCPPERGASRRCCQITGGYRMNPTFAEKLPG